ncbi:MAG: hypothetical protein K2H20_04275, partial [Bacilli bacterium]|nr:hypothetical protein [Bacilli bacterium]
MSRTNKITAFTIFGIFVAIISLFTCVTVFGSSNANVGIALEYIEVFDVKINDVSEIYFEEGTFQTLKNPNIDEKNTINYGLLLKRPDKYAQFQFNMENKGNVDIKVKNITILGYEEYKDYIDIELVGINVGDKIEKSTIISGVKAITTYKSPLYIE